MNNVRYRYQGIPRNFWVYGRERAVLCPDYPKGTCAKLCAQLGLCGGDEGEDGDGKKNVLKYIGGFFSVLLSVGVIVGVLIYQYVK